ncbi:hypothetical protein [Blastococcus sp. SYSU D00813]
MTGPVPAWQPPGQPGATAVVPSVTWDAAAPAPAAARRPVDVAGVLRLAAGGLLAVAGGLTAVAPFLTLYSLAIDGEEAFRTDGWGSADDGPQTPVRWAIPVLLAAAALLVAGVLLVVSRWVVRLRTAAAAVGAVAAGAAVAVGWMLGPFVDSFVASWETGGFGDTDYDASSGAGTVLVLVATWLGLAAVVPLVLAPVVDAVRARTAGGAR